MPAFPWTDFEVRRALGLPAHPSEARVRYHAVSTDSRKTHPGDLYVALVGSRFDGHDFVPEAVAGGAKGVVASRLIEAGAEVVVYPVADTLVALGALAAHRRGLLTGQVVAITGSSGKTATKDLTAAALGSTLRVHATLGNLNNRVGLPLTLLTAPSDADVVVAEMGTNEPGEIATLTAIARPDIGVVTTVGESHLEKLGSVEGVLQEKLALLEGLGPDGRAVVGDTPEALPAEARRLRPGVRVAGWTERADADLRPVDVVTDATGAHAFEWRGARVSLGVPGRHLVYDALLALAVSEMLGVGPAAAAQGISAVQAGWMRGEVRRVGGLTLLLDCYNANPLSVRAALDVLEGYAARARVAVLGSMLELGASSEDLHRRVLSDALARGLDTVVVTGAFAQAARGLERRGQGPELVLADQVEDAYSLLERLLHGDEVVLLKGSRGVALERLIPLIERDFGKAEASGRAPSGPNAAHGGGEASTPSRGPKEG